MKVELDTVTLTVTELKVLVENASKDTVRPHLASLCFEPRRKIVVAVDGHVLIALYLGDEISPQDKHGKQWLVPAADVSAVIKGYDSKVEMTFEFGDRRIVPVKWLNGSLLMSTELKLADDKFPPYDQVIPAKAQGESSVGAFSFDVSLFSRVVNARKALGGKSLGIRVRFPDDELSPIRFDAEGDEGLHMLYVLMPMRPASSERARPNRARTTT